MLICVHRAVNFGQEKTKVRACAQPGDLPQCTLQYHWASIVVNQWWCNFLRSLVRGTLFVSCCLRLVRGTFSLDSQMRPDLNFLEHKMATCVHIQMLFIAECRNSSFQCTIVLHADGRIANVDEFDCTFQYELRKCKHINVHSNVCWFMWAYLLIIISCMHPCVIV